MAPEDAFTGKTDVPEGHDAFLAYIRDTKTANVPHDLPPCVRVWGSQPFRWEVTAFIDTMERDKALWAASMVAGLVGGAEGVTMVSDAFTAAGDSRLNPATDEPWGHGELNQAWEDGDRTNVTECLIFHTTWPDGRHRAETSRYVIAGDTLRWTRSDTDLLDTAIQDGSAVSGTVPESLLAALTERPEALDMLDGLFGALGLDDERRHVHRIAACVQLLQQANILVMVGGDSPFLLERLGAVEGAHEIKRPEVDPLEQMLRDA